MTVFDVMKSALMAGFGVQEKVREFIDELVKKGELSESQGAKLVKEWSEKVDKSSSEWNKSISDIMSKTLEKMNIPTRDEMEKLNKKLNNLAARLKKLEGVVEEEGKEE